MSPVKTKTTEILVTTFLVQHNFPLAFALVLFPLFKTVFPDSQTAKSFASAKTKTTCIMNEALRPHFTAELVQVMQQQPFSLATDGSSDKL